MTRPVQFGDVIRVDPKNLNVLQPDDRRWLILTPAMMGRQWLTLFLGPSLGSIGPTIVPWKALTGFIVVEGDDE